MRRVPMISLTLAMLLSLVACGAAPQAAAPTERPTAAGETFATAVPAATAAQVAAPAAAQTLPLPTTAPPEASLVPRTT